MEKKIEQVKKSKVIVKGITQKGTPTIEVIIEEDYKWQKSN
jgi:hypothetical protein